MYFQRLKDLREDNDFTQKDIAEKLFMKQQQYQRYEKGTAEMKIQILIMLADLYNVSLDYITGRTNDKRGIGYSGEK